MGRELPVWPAMTEIAADTSAIAHCDFDAAPCRCVTHYRHGVACTSITQKLIAENIDSYSRFWLYERTCESCGEAWLTVPKYTSRGGGKFWRADWAEKVVRTLESRARNGWRTTLFSLMRTARRAIKAAA